MSYANDDLVIWQDGTTCKYSELEQFLVEMGDDYEVVPFEEITVTQDIRILDEPEFTFDWCSSDLK